MTKTEIGKITKAQGVKGEFRLRPNAYEFAHYVDIKVMSFDGKDYDVEHVSLRNGFVVVKLKGINDRNLVETLVGTTIYAEMPKRELADNEYYVESIVGLEVVDSKSKKYLGVISQINNYGSTDVYTVETEASEYMFPVARGVIVKVDLDNKKLFVNSKILDEIKSE